MHCLLDPSILVMSEFFGKIKKKNVHQRTPYTRPQNKSLFSRVSSTVKNLLTPIKHHWLSKGMQTPMTGNCMPPKMEFNKSNTKSGFDHCSTSQELIFQNVQTRRTSSPYLDAQTSTMAKDNADNSNDRNPFSSSTEFSQLWSNAAPANESAVTVSSYMADILVPSTKVQYGGAMAKRSGAYPVPYRIPSIRTTEVKTTSRGVRNHSENSSSPMSSTAQKILSTLNKLSTPLHDANKIPPPKHHLSYCVVHQNGIQDKSRSNFSLLPAPPCATQGRDSIFKTANIPLDGKFITPVGRRKVLNKAGKEMVMDNGGQSNAALSGAGGKMKMQRRTVHYTAVPKQDDLLDSPPVPHVPFPVSKTLPSFNFGVPERTSTPAVSKAHHNKNQAELLHPKSRQPEFSFSDPVQRYHTPTEQLCQGTSAEPLFEFQPPQENTKSKIYVAKQHDRETKPKELKSQECISEKWIPCEDKRFVKPSKLLVASGSVMDVLGPGYGYDHQENSKCKAKLASNLKDKWECQTCMLWNNSNAEKCVACQTKKVETAVAASASTKGDWKCDVCLLLNKICKKTCAACQAPYKQGSVQAKLRPEDKWECPVCLIRNKTEHDNCAACKEPKPSKDIKISKHLNSNNKWECNSCLLRNGANKTKCVACLTPRAVTADPSSSVQLLQTGNSKGEVMKTNLNKHISKWECNTCLLQNRSDLEKCVACQSAKPDLIEKNGSQLSFGTASKSLFQFGSSENAPSKKDALSVVSCNSDLTSSVTIQSSYTETSVSENNQQCTYSLANAGASFGTRSFSSTDLKQSRPFKSGVLASTADSVTPVTPVQTNKTCDVAVVGSNGTKERNADKTNFGSSICFGVDSSKTKVASTQSSSLLTSTGTSIAPVNTSFSFSTPSKLVPKNDLFVSSALSYTKPIDSEQPAFQFGANRDTSAGCNFGKLPIATDHHEKQTFQFNNCNQVVHFGSHHDKQNTTASFSSNVLPATQTKTSSTFMFNIGQATSARPSTPVAGRQIKRATRRFKK